MKIVVFERTVQNRSEIDFIHEKLAPGLSVLGDAVEISLAKYVACDVAAIMWSPRNGWPERARAARAIRNLHGRNLLIVETPLIRGLRRRHHRVGFDHVHRGGRFYAENMPDDRAKAMGLALAPWKEDRSGAIVIAGQLPGDFSLDGVDVTEWAIDVASHVERFSRRRIVIRPHPLDLHTDWGQAASSLGVEISRQPLKHDLARAETWIALTSGSAIDAAIAGVPVICLSPHNFAGEVSSHSLDGLEKPWRGDRCQWLANLAYTQWTPDEIAAGDCWRRLRGLVEI